MIDRQLVLDCAEKAGFGGQSRPTILPRLLKFAALISEQQRRYDAAACWEIGKKFCDAQTEFSDGQMDGAYQCAERLEGKNEAAA